MSGRQVCRVQVLQTCLMKLCFTYKLPFYFFRNCQLAERYQLQAILRTDIYAPAAQNTFRTRRLITFKDRVDPTLQTASGLAARLVFAVACLHFHHARPAINRNHGNRKPGVLIVGFRHLVMIKNCDLHIPRARFPFSSSQIVIDVLCRLLAVGNRTDDQTRTKRNIPGGEDSGRAAHEGVFIYLDSALTSNLYLISLSKERKIRSLTNG